MRSGIESETYAALGLYESSGSVSGYPRVLQLLSSVLEKSILLDGSARKKDVITVFHGSKSPSLTIKQYIERIFRYSKCSASCFVVGYIYIRRFLLQMDAFLSHLNVHRLLITSIMLAAKFLDDQCCNNAYYAKVGGVSTAEMNRMEMKFLFKLDFRLQVTLEDFRNSCFNLERETIGDYHIHAWPPPKRTWQNTHKTSTRRAM
ncbi:cyclin-P3-1 [Euphorbia lathyris]|uniref:cyclin-P3-1 n=1 Tax=Euphorbia lathyris TaxID=212925 RepID=UPI00331317AE